MMRHALVALGPKSVATGILVGGAALVLGALFVPQKTAAAGAMSGMSRLVLYAPERPGAFYLSAWNDGDVFVAHSEQPALTFVRRGDEHDGCTWQGVERLLRIDAHHYSYDYRETLLSCRPDAQPFDPTPRTGIVTIEAWDRPATATALTATQPPGELWNISRTAFEDDRHCLDHDDADDDSADDDESADLDDESADLDDESADRDGDSAQAGVDFKSAIDEARQHLIEAQRELARLKLQAVISADKATTIQ